MKADTIITAAEELFMKYGIKSISMDDIASQLGISKKTLYRFVKTKEDLINKAILSFHEKEKEIILIIIKHSDDALDEQMKIARNGIRNLRKMRPTMIFDLQKYYPKSWKLLQDVHFKFTEELVHHNLAKGMKEGIYREDLNPDTIAKFFVGQTNMLLDEKLFPSREFSREKLFKEYIYYHLQGIVSPKGYVRLDALIKSIDI